MSKKYKFIKYIEEIDDEEYITLIHDKDEGIIVLEGDHYHDKINQKIEGFIEGRYSQMSAHRICKNKIIWVIPQFPGSKAILSLPLSFCPQILKCDFRRLYLPGLSALRAGGNVVRRVFLLFLLELLADGNSLGFKVHLFPRKPQTLPLT